MTEMIKKKTSRNFNSHVFIYYDIYDVNCDPVVPVQPVTDAPVPGLSLGLPPCVLLHPACQRYKRTGCSSNIFFGIRERGGVTQRVCVIAALRRRGKGGEEERRWT